MAVELHSAGAPTDGDRLIGTLGDWQPGIGTFPDVVVDGRAEGGLRSDKSCYRSGVSTVGLRSCLPAQCVTQGRHVLAAQACGAKAD
jgi:hypothetical protein